MPTQNNISQNITQQKFSTSHVIDVNLACQYGVDEALLIHHFCFWISFNKRMNKNFIDGKTWMYQTQKEMAAYHPYWTIKHIMRIIQSLIKQGVLVCDNHSDNKFKKTQWYAFKSEEMFMITTPASLENPKPDFRKEGNGVSYIGKDTEREDTEKQQHKPSRKQIAATQKPQSAAASSFKKKLPEKKEPPGEERKEPLKEVPIPDSDKQWLKKAFDLPTIEAAVAWATNPTTKLKKTLAAAIKWFCSLEPKSRPLVPEKQEDQIEKNRQLAKQVEQKITHANGYEFIATNKLCYIDRGAYAKTVEIQYTTPNFKETLHNVLKDFRFKRKNE